MIYFSKPVPGNQTCQKKKKKKRKNFKFRIFRFCPTFDMLHLKVNLVQKCKRHLCCNLFWDPTQFDWTIVTISFF